MRYLWSCFCSSLGTFGNGGSTILIWNPSPDPLELRGGRVSDNWSFVGFSLTRFFQVICIKYTIDMDGDITVTLRIRSEVQWRSTVYLGYVNLFGNAHSISIDVYWRLQSKALYVYDPLALQHMTTIEPGAYGAADSFIVYVICPVLFLWFLLKLRFLPDRMVSL